MPVSPVLLRTSSSTSLAWILGCAAIGVLVSVVAVGAMYLFLFSSTEFTPAALVAGTAGTPTKADTPAFAGASTGPATAVETEAPEIPTATYFPSSESTSVPQPVSTSAPTTGACSDNAEFVADVTIPDGTVMYPGQSFVKTWRLRNSGDCPWDGSYTLDFTGGEQMGGDSPQAVEATDTDGTLDISLAMIAPSAPGRHTGQWQMSSPDGELFGTAVTVVIVVPSPATPVPTPIPTSAPLPSSTPSPPAACSGTPNVPSFDASPDTITDGDSSTLSWGAVTNATSVSIDPDIGGISTPGSVDVSPGTTTTYTLTAVCGGTNSIRVVHVTVTVNAAAIHSQGTLSIPEDSTADLDAGKLDVAGADIWFEARTATNRFVTSQNGATIAKFGTTEPGRSDCASASLEDRSININNLPSGTFVCVFTNKGRYGQFSVTATVGASPGTLKISFTTWDN